MLQLAAKILYNKRVKDNYFHMAMRAPRIAAAAQPGQFLNIKVSEGHEPLLRRPFSVHGVKGPDVELLYEVVGDATGILSGCKSGQCLDVIGPLGGGFKYPLHATRHKLSVLVAGGMGVAPLIFLAERLCKSRNLVLIGAKNKERLLCEKDFRDLGCEVKMATDDGSRGFKGYICGLLEKELGAVGDPAVSIYACGPRPMLKEVARISKKHKIAAQVSMEEHMACGIGACLGCAVNTKQGFKRACKEGPVFNAEEIAW